MSGKSELEHIVHTQVLTDKFSPKDILWNQHRLLEERRERQSGARLPLSP